MATALRTYHRPVKEGESQLETWDQVVDRVISHQKWLWERALARGLNEREEDELDELLDGLEDELEDSLELELDEAEENELDELEVSVLTPTIISS